MMIGSITAPAGEQPAGIGAMEASCPNKPYTEFRMMVPAWRQTRPACLARWLSSQVEGFRLEGGSGGY